MKTLIRRAPLFLILLVLLSLHYSQSLEIGCQIKAHKGQVNEASLFPSKASRSTPWLVKEGLVFEGFKEKGLDGKRPKAADEVLQFVAGGHVLGFRKGNVFIASGDHALRIEFVNARPVFPSNEGISSDKGNNRQAAAPLGRIFYSDLWDGVTLVYERHGSGVVKSTYTVQSAGTDASSPVDLIRLRYNVPVAVEESGNLVLSFETGQMKESRPVAWQEIKGEHIPVEVSFCSLSDREVGFKVGSYDPQFPLVIDPVLSWHTYMGSSSDDYGNAIAVDGSGNIYVTGWTEATWGTPINPYAGGKDAFVAKLNHEGARLWHTFMESGSGHGKAIAVDGSGNIYVGGGCDNPWGAPINPHSGDWDIFVAKIDRGIRIASWNILNYSGLNEDSREEDFRKVIDMIEPDILVVQEMESAEGVNHFLRNVLNSKSSKQYKAAKFFDGPDTDNALFYDKTKLELQSSQQIPTSFRDISEYCLKIKEGPGKDCEFNIYSVHLKEGLGASNRKQRKNEANTLRTYLNGLSPESHFLVCGTFNMISSNEKAYKVLTGDLINNIGRLKDPTGRFGRWHNKMKFRPTHTESTRKTKFGEGESGGLDDRFDMILISYGLDQDGELTYGPGSCNVFGNDGKHLNKAIKEPMNKVVSPEIADALYKASDHLPVIIDLVFWD